MTWSVNGLHWANSTMVQVPGGCEAPMGILPRDTGTAVGSSEGDGSTHARMFTVWWNKRGRYDELFAAQFVLGFANGSMAASG